MTQYTDKARSSFLAAFVWAFALAAFLGLPATVSAQEINPIEVEPDPNGVDLLTGAVNGELPTLSIPAAPELTFSKLDDFYPLLQGKVPSGGNSTTDDTSYQINAGGLASDGFACFDVCSGKNDVGSVLDGGPTVGPFIYTQGGSGRQIRFDEKRGFTSNPVGGDTFFYMGTEVTTPGGPTLTFVYDRGNNPIAGTAFWEVRPATVTSTSGYQLKFTYKNNTDPSSYLWRTLEKVEIVALSAPNTPLASLEYGSGTVEDIAGRIYQCDGCNQTVSGPGRDSGTQMTLPGETLPSFDVTCVQPGYSGCGNPDDRTLTITRDGVAYDYAITHDGYNYNQGYGAERVVITGAGGFYRRVEVEVNNPPGQGLQEPRRRVTSVTNSENQTTTYNYFSASNAPWSRVESIDYPGGRSTSIAYDTSANVTSLTTTSVDGTLTQSATYNIQFECTNVTCFRPTTTTDANGNVTDYTWSTAHGGLLTQLDPADENNIRAKTKNTYDSDGRLIRSEICETNLSGVELTCGTANSFVTEFTYWGDTRLPETQTATDGAGAGPLTTTFGYDPAGRLLVTDGALPGSDDATYARYDVLGRMTWEIGPKGENGNRQATLTDYRDADDQVERVRSGTVAGSTTTSPATPTFLAVITDVDTDYNARRLATRATVSTGSGTPVSITQMSYDALNRQDCSAVRMNLSGVPTDACVAGTPNADGEDRITRQHYDSESRIVRIEQGVGTPLARTYVFYMYTPNGQVENVIDARGNRAKYNYDGFGRLERWWFPNETLPSNFVPNTGSTQPSGLGVPNWSDYEQYTYDNNGNRTSLRKRDSSIITYEYDALNRMTKKALPEVSGLNSLHTRDIFYEYDIRGLQTAARLWSGHGERGVFYTYDRYGRLTEERQRTDDNVSRSIGSAYDANGNRTRVTYPDGRYFDYGYSPASDLVSIKNQWGTLLVDVDYNSLGLPSSINRWSSTPDQAFSYDPVGRLASTGWINAGSSSVNWNYTRNSASQIQTETQSNDSYSWDGHVNVDRAYTSNGLNQYTAAGSANFTYDANGNLTSDGSKTYQYDLENRLVKATGGGQTTELYYDPLGRLYRIQDSQTGQTNFIHDGNALIAEYNASGAMTRRHIHGSNVDSDDPLVSYNGAGLSSVNDARYLFADPRGSIVMVTKRDVNTAVLNTYDAYGIPDTASGNDIATKGRFRYTGQAWIPELGMYYYKARIYSPTLGRFLQTDPIGYEDNVNLYGYVGQDPINGVDPTGLYDCGETDGEACVVAKEAKDDLEKAADNVPTTVNGSRARAASIRGGLRRASRDFGSENDDNGITFQTGDLGGDLGLQVDEGGGRSTITIDPNEARKAGWSYGAVVGHEIRHHQQTFGRRAGNTFDAALLNEIEAYSYGYLVQAYAYPRSAAVSGGVAAYHRRLRAHIGNHISANSRTTVGPGYVDSKIRQYGLGRILGD